MAGRIWIDIKPGIKPGWTMSPERKLHLSIAMKAVRANQKLLRENYNARHNSETSI